MNEAFREEINGEPYIFIVGFTKYENNKPSHKRLCEFVNEKGKKDMYLVSPSVLFVYPDL